MGVADTSKDVQGMLNPSYSFRKSGVSALPVAVMGWQLNLCLRLWFSAKIPLQVPILCSLACVADFSPRNHLIAKNEWLASSYIEGARGRLSRPDKGKQPLKAT